MKGVIIDDDKSLGYETNSLFRKIGNFLLVPILNFLPVSTRKLLRKTHKSAEEIIEHATTHRAMEILYDRRKNWGSENPIKNFFLSIWLGTNNSKAVRNRLRLVKREIKNKINELVSSGKEVRILNIASGAARAVLESIDEMSLNKDVNLSATFVDMNHDAILFSQELAGSHKYKSSFRWIKDSAQNFFKTNDKNEKFNIIEMVGLLEYLSDAESIEIFSMIYKELEPGGVVITANIGHNIERRFISDVVGWKMNYRKIDEFTSLLMAGGFELDKMKIYFEPQRIHCVIVAQK
jgi:hypothetical protein